MPICTVYLLSLNVTLSEFLAAVSTFGLTPLTIGRVVRWIITPSKISVDPLLRKDANWDLLMIIPNTDGLPQSLRAMVRKEWSVKAGVPSRLLRGFAAKNERLLGPQPGDIPPLTGSLDSSRKAGSAQALELSDELRDWIRTFGTREGQGAVSMLNLLAFKDGMKEEYLKYGKAFGESIGIRRGGTAKIVGTVIDVSSSPPGVKEWDEIALAHYPSIFHFADMLASEGYQEVNHRHRVPALKDTFILCTTELGLPSSGKDGSKL
jgi:hypothetical protein